MYLSIYLSIYVWQFATGRYEQAQIIPHIPHVFVSCFLFLFCFCFVFCFFVISILCHSLMKTIIDV